MDKERARFVLKSFRPDGADSMDLDFAEALQIATSDRELGEWLVRERAFDAEFAEALARVDLPEGLRESVLLAMVRDGGGLPKPDTGFDGEMISAVGGIEVPDGLRAQIIEAMERTVKVESPAPGWRRFGIPLAAAAGIALAFVYAKKDDPAQVVEKGNRISIDAVQVGFMNAFESPLFSLDQVDSNAPHLMSYLRNKGLPCGEGYLPPGLVGLDGVGCRELVIDGKKGSLLCFDDTNGTVHLVIFKRDDVDGGLPGITDPEIEQSGAWAKARWEKAGYVFTLLGVRDKASLGEFF